MTDVQISSPPAEPHFDSQLLYRYDSNLPRYTSYPSANHWDTLASATIASTLSALRGQTQPISVYVHLPFCDRLCLYCGCNVVVSNSQERIGHYVDTLIQEIDHVSRLVGPQHINQLHLGGGTPTLLSPPLLEKVLGKIVSVFQPTADADFSIEIDPVVTQEDHYRILRDFGFKRLSIGVQDFEPALQQIVKRNQSVAHTQQAITWARSYGFNSINIDLMYGLPTQTPAHLRNSAALCASLDVDRVAVFGYAHVPWMRPQQKKLEIFSIPGMETRWQMYNAARTELVGAGYNIIGFDHFAKPSDPMAIAARNKQLKRNFQGFTVLPSDNLLAFGTTAISDICGVYLQNNKEIGAYLEKVREGRLAIDKGYVRTADDKIRGRVIMNILCHLEVVFSDIRDEFAINPETYFGAELGILKMYAHDGLLTLHNNGLQVNEQARPFLRTIAAVFDTHLKKGEQQYSKAF